MAEYRDERETLRRRVTELEKENATLRESIESLHAGQEAARKPGRADIKMHMRLASCAMFVVVGGVAVQLVNSPFLTPAVVFGALGLGIWLQSSASK